jgi:hypothetical protein
MNAATDGEAYVEWVSTHEPGYPGSSPFGLYVTIARKLCY